MTYEIHNGDCAEVMASMEESSVDAIVTDPPYGIAFMGVAWDTYKTEAGKRKGGSRTSATFDQVGGNHHPTCAADQARTRKSENAKFQTAMTPIFEEALRVAKPGAYLLCFGGTRTFHRMACAIEDAGWEIRNTIMWVFGSGFPKGQSVERLLGDDPAAKDWVGWNTQIKPAFEPIVVARKPIDGTVAHNVRTWGTGAVNVDACRIPTYSEGSGTTPESSTDGRRRCMAGSMNRVEYNAGKGRFPANLVHDGSDEVLACFPDSKGQIADRKAMSKSSVNCYGSYGEDSEFLKRGDSGSAARFFYCAKANKKDRNRGGVDNDHVSVKPNDLMRWLVRLVCRQGGIVLDPFMGSGSTGVACMDEGMSFIGIDMDEHYCEIAEARIKAADADNAQTTLF